MIYFYDNGGDTFDRFTMAVKAGKMYDVYNFSANALAPDGVNMFSGTMEINLSSIDGILSIDFDDIPLEVQKAMIKRLMPDEK